MCIMINNVNSYIFEWDQLYYYYYFANIQIANSAHTLIASCEKQSLPVAKLLYGAVMRSCNLATCWRLWASFGIILIQNASCGRRGRSSRPSCPDSPSLIRMWVKPEEWKSGAISAHSPQESSGRLISQTVRRAAFVQFSKKVAQ